MNIDVKRFFEKKIKNVENKDLKLNEPFLYNTIHNHIDFDFNIAITMHIKLSKSYSKTELSKELFGIQDDIKNIRFTKEF